MKALGQFKKAILLLTALLAGCATVPHPREVEPQYSHLTCPQLFQGQWHRINERMEAEAWLYGGPGAGEMSGWIAAVLALAYYEPASATLVGPAARLRRAQVQAYRDALNVHIAVLSALYEERCINHPGSGTP